MYYDMGVTQKNPGAPGEVRDALTDILRHGAHQLLAQAPLCQNSCRVAQMNS